MRSSVAQLLPRLQPSIVIAEDIVYLIFPVYEMHYSQVRLSQKDSTNVSSDLTRILAGSSKVPKGLISINMVPPLTLGCRGLSGPISWYLKSKP